MTTSLAGPAALAGRKAGTGFVTSFGGSLDRGGRRIAGAGDKLTKGLTLPIIGLGALAVKSFADFDSAMNQSIAIMGDVSGTMRDKMEVAARDVAKTTTFSATQAAESYFFLASAGLNAEQSIAALPQVAAFAQAGMFDMATATDLATDAQSALGLVASDAGANLENLTRVTDVLVKANTLANASVEQFSEALTNKAGAALKVANKDMEEGVAVLAAYADQGVKGAEAGEGLSILLRDVTRAAGANKDEFEALGISVFDSQGNLRNMADVIGEFEGVLGGMSDAEKAATLDNLGLTRSVGDQVKVLLGSSEAIREYEGELRDAGGTTQEIADKQLQSMSAQLGLAKDKVMDAAITLGGALAPAIIAAVDAAEPLITGMGVLATKFAEADPATQKWIVGIIGVVAVLGPVLSIVGRLARTIGKTIKGIAAFGRGAVKAAKFAGRMGQGLGRGAAAMGRMSVTAGKFGGRVAAGVGRAAVAFGRLSVAAGRAAGRVVAAGARMAVSAAKTAARVVAQIALQVARWAVLGAQALLHAAKVALAWLISMGPIALVAAGVIALGVLVVKNFDKIKRAISVAFNWVKNNWPLLLTILTGPLGLAVLVIKSHWTKITGFARKALNWVKRNWPTILAVLTGPIGLAALLIARNWQRIRDGVSGVKRWIVSRFNNVVSFVRGLPGRISSAASGMWDGIKIAFKAAINAVIGWWNGLGFTLPVIDIPSVSVPGFGTIGGGSLGGQTFNTPNITPLAAGGIVSKPLLSITGDTPGDSEVVAPLKKLRPMLFDAVQEAALAQPRSGSGSAPAEVTLILDSRGSRLDDALVWTLANTVRTKHGGNVQVLTGKRR